jgi:glutamate-1-semialdehyde 2,1-aminomutase
MVRMTSSGTEASMSAIRRPARPPGRDKLLKFAGAYHGHLDGLLAEAGSGPGDAGDLPVEPGRPAPGHAEHDHRAVERPGRRRAGVRRARVRRDPRRAVPGEHGPRPAGRHVPRDLREQATANGALLVFDEVISGFRVNPGGAQEREGVAPDLTVMGKVVGGGLPAAAYGGSRALMERIAPAGDVYQAGTLSGNPLAVAAALTALSMLDDAAYLRLKTTTETLAAGLRDAAASAGVSVQVPTVPGLLTVFFTDTPVRTYADAQATDTEAYAAWCRALLARGVYAPPSAYEAWFPSLAHGPEHLERTLEVATAAFGELAS